VIENKTSMIAASAQRVRLLSSTSFVIPSGYASPARTEESLTISAMAASFDVLGNI
jgi:hypothetical protein